MVVFTCSHCGESLQKPRVEKHYQTTCRNPIAVTCMDCFKDFKLQEYVSHTKCITEEERYSAAGTVQGGPKKGEMKQISWVATINNLIEAQKDLKPNEKTLLEVIAKHENVPRKKTKFLNFMTSTSGGKINMEDVEAVWNILETQKKSTQEEKKTESEATELKTSKKKKRKADTGEATANEVDTKKQKSDVSVEVENEKKNIDGAKLSKSQKRKLAKEAGNAEEMTVISETTEIPNKKKKKNKGQVEEVKIGEAEENGDNPKKKKNKKGKNTETQEVKENGSFTKNKKNSESQEGSEVKTNGVSPKKNKKNGKKNQEANGVANGVSNGEVEKTNKIRGQLNASGEVGEPFKWNEIIVDILKKHTGGISREDLQKKITKMYCEAKGGSPSSKQMKNYNRKLKKNEKIVLKENIFTFNEN